MDARSSDPAEEMWPGESAIEMGVPQGRRLSLSRYSLLSAAGLALTGVQILLLPRLLAPGDFGLVILSISVTQGVLQLGDLGIYAACIDRGRSPEERAMLRSQGQALSVVATVLVAVTAAAVPLLVPGALTLCVALSLGALAAGMVTGEKYRAADRQAAGDEGRAAAHHFMWGNIPKVGLLVAAPLTHNPLLILAASAAGGALLCRPYVPSPRWAAVGLRNHVVWSHTFIAIVSSFILTWGDTYFLTARLGLAGAAGYEALYRIFSMCSYGYLPWSCVIISRIHTGERHPLLRPTVLALAVTAALLLASLAFAAAGAPRIFPRLPLPMAAAPILIALFMLAPLGACFGNGLYARGDRRTPMLASLLSALLSVSGHLIFTLHGGVVAAASVSTVAMAASVAVQGIGYRRLVGR